MSEPWSGLGTGVLRDAPPGREGGGADGEAELVVLRVLVVLVSPQQDVGQAGLAHTSRAQDHQPGTREPDTSTTQSARTTSPTSPSL